VQLFGDRPIYARVVLLLLWPSDAYGYHCIWKHIVLDGRLEPDHRKVFYISCYPVYLFDAYESDAVSICRCRANQADSAGNVCMFVTLPDTIWWIHCAT